MVPYPSVTGRRGWNIVFSDGSGHCSIGRGRDIHALDYFPHRERMVGRLWYSWSVTGGNRGGFPFGRCL